MAISALALATDSEPWRTVLTTLERLFCMFSMAISSSDTSSVPCTTMCCVRSPRATAFTTASALMMPWRMERDRMKAIVVSTVPASNSVAPARRV